MSLSQLNWHPTFSPMQVEIMQGALACAAAFAVAVLVLGMVLSMMHLARYAYDAAKNQLPDPVRPSVRAMEQSRRAISRKPRNWGAR